MGSRTKLSSSQSSSTGIIDEVDLYEFEKEQKLRAMTGEMVKFLDLPNRLRKAHNKIVLNTSYGGFHIDNRLRAILAGYDIYVERYGDAFQQRRNPHFIALVEAILESREKNLPYFNNIGIGDLEVVPIQSKKYIIHEYDGKERVILPSDITWMPIKKQRIPKLESSEIVNKLIKLLKSNNMESIKHALALADALEVPLLSLLQKAAGTDITNKVAYHNSYGGFDLAPKTQKILEILMKKKNVWVDTWYGLDSYQKEDVRRHDPRLIAAILIGNDSLDIQLDTARGNKYVIAEYDGWERVMYSIKWTTAP